MKRGVVVTIGLCFLMSVAVGSSAYAAKSHFHFEPIDLDAALNPFTPQLPKVQIVKDKAKPETPKSRRVKEYIIPKNKLRDLSYTIIVKKSEPPSLSIAGLIWNSDHPQAIINGEVVGVGDVVADAEITSISKAGIEVAFEGEIFTVQ